MAHPFDEGFEANGVSGPGGEACDVEFPGGRLFVVFEGSGVLNSPHSCHSFHRIDANQATLESRVEGETAPRPIDGMIGQFSFQGIHVHVVKLFHPFL